MLAALNMEDTMWNTVAVLPMDSEQSRRLDGILRGISLQQLRYICSTGIIWRKAAEPKNALVYW